MKWLVALAVLFGAASNVWALQQYGSGSSGGGGGGDILETLVLVVAPTIFAVSLWSLLTFDSIRKEHHERELKKVEEEIDEWKRNVFELKVVEGYQELRDEIKKLKSLLKEA